MRTFLHWLSRIRDWLLLSREEVERFVAGAMPHEHVEFYASPLPAEVRAALTRNDVPFSERAGLGDVEVRWPDSIHALVLGDGSLGMMLPDGTIIIDARRLTLGRLPNHP